MSFLYPGGTSHAGEITLNQNSTLDFQTSEGKTRGQVHEQRSAMVLRPTQLIHLTHDNRLSMEGKRVLAFSPIFDTILNRFQETQASLKLLFLEAP